MTNLNPTDGVGDHGHNRVMLMDLDPEVRRKLEHFDELLAALRRFDDFCENGHMKKLMTTNNPALRMEYADIRLEMIMAVYRYDNPETLP